MGLAAEANGVVPEVCEAPESGCRCLRMINRDPKSIFRGLEPSYRGMWSSFTGPVTAYIVKRLV